MPSKSKQQQKFMGIVRSIQKGEEPSSKFSKAAQKAAKSMKKSSVKKYAKTKHDDLPIKKEERDYKDEYKKFQSSTKAKKYRAELNKYNRKKGTYGNGDGKDASHKGGKIVGFESQSKNRGRAEKSRLKKEGVITENPAAIAAGVRAAMARAKEKELSSGGGKKVKVSTALANKSHPKHKQAKGIIQRIKDKAKSMLSKSKKKKAEPKKQSKSDANFYARQFGGTSESVNEAMSESQRFKVYNSLKKGDIVSIKYDSSIQKGSKYIPYVVTKGKTKLMKGKIERIILKSPKNPRFKAYLYNRDGDVSLALGDMAASIVDMKKGKVKESVDERKFNHKKVGDDYMGGVNSPKGDTEMFADKKGKYYLWVKPKGKKAKYIDLPKRIKSRSDADNFHDKIKKSMGESVDERLKKGQKIIALNPKDKTLKGKVGVIYSVGIGKSTSYVVQVGKGKKARFVIMTDKEIKLKESVDERIPAGKQKLVYQFKKLSTSQMDELDAMFARAGINGVPDFNKKTWSTYANRDAMKLKKNKTLQKFIKLKGGQQIKEGFGGELKGSEKKKFENDRKKNGEQLGYTLTGESDVKETLRRVVKEEVSNIISERMDKRQAGETLKQLGGNKFIAMTGAKNFAVGPKGMGFKIGRNSKSINYVRIDLKSNDLYDMEFIRLRKSQIKVVKRVTGVYNDQLQKMFTKYTGMYTSL